MAFIHYASSWRVTMTRRKQTWTEGDNFLVPLKDGRFIPGQVIRVAKSAMDSALCVFGAAVYERPSETLETITPEGTVAILFVTRDLLDSGRWKVRHNSPNSWAAEFIGFKALQDHGFVGTQIIGSGNVESFLNAFHNLQPWNAFHDPAYLDSLLLSSDRRPKTLTFLPTE